MNFHVHLLIGIIISLLLSNFTKYDYFSINNLIIHFLIIIFSILPDVDISNSKAGKFFGFLSSLINFIFGHRGFFHSIWIVGLLYVVLVTFGYQIAVIGYLGHLFVDMFTKDGIKLFYPYFKINGFLPSNKIINLILIVVMVIIICFLILTMIV